MSEIQPNEIQPGRHFDTPAESGCVVLTAPDEFGTFRGLDSDGVECSFMVAMVKRIAS
jgi:hypothetical protein